MQYESLSSKHYKSTLIFKSNYTGCLINNGENEVAFHRSQQQRNYLMNHDESTTQRSPNRRRIELQRSISRDHHSTGRDVFKSESNRRSRIVTSKNSGVYMPKKNRMSFMKNREPNRKRIPFNLPDCNPSTGCVNVTKTFATLGRTASMNCVAENLVGQKTVSNRTLCDDKEFSTCIYGNQIRYNSARKQCGAVRP